MIANLQTWFSQNPSQANWIFVIGILLVIVISYLITDRLLVRGLLGLANRTETSYDDIVLKRLHPHRISLFVPLLLIYFFAYLFGNAEEIVQEIALFLMLWLGFSGGSTFGSGSM